MSQWSSIRVYSGGTLVTTYGPSAFPSNLTIDSTLETAVLAQLAVDNLPTSGVRIVYIPVSSNTAPGTMLVPSQVEGDWVVTGDLGVGGNITGSSLSVTGDITAFGSVSDLRLKTEVSELTDGLAVVNQLRPVSFRWREDITHAEMRGKSDVGFIAQEIQQTVPEASTHYFDYLAIKHERLLPYLVRAIQEIAERH